MSKIDLKKIKAAATAATPGDWYWECNHKSHNVSLRTHSGMGNIVLDFVRWGMNSAAPRFNIDGLMRRVDDLLAVIPGREHHASWYKRVDHPDAEHIATMNPQTTLALVEALEKMARSLGKKYCRSTKETLADYGIEGGDR